MIKNAEYNVIISDSLKKINKLKILVNFFNKEYLINICVRIQIIHQLFENNKELDIYKLSIFNTQFTDTVIELLANLKKIKEQNILILDTEIRLNNEYLSKLKTIDYSDIDKIEFNKTVSKILKNCYTILSKGYDDIDPFYDYNFNKKYNSIFKEISSQELNNIEKYEEKFLYLNNRFKIQKKLMGVLNKFNFKIEFILGLKCSTIFVDIFKVDNYYFSFIPYKNLFLFCDESIIKGINDKVITKYNLINKINDLEAQILKTRSEIPVDIEITLNNFLTKINEINFLESLQEVDIQNNILKNMLNTKIIN